MKTTCYITNTILFAIGGYCAMSSLTDGNFSAFAWILTALISRCEILFWLNRTARCEAINKLFRDMGIKAAMLLIQNEGLLVKKEKTEDENK